MTLNASYVHLPYRATEHCNSLDMYCAIAPPALYSKRQSKSQKTISYTHIKRATKDQGVFFKVIIQWLKQLRAE